jgi:hypothetical protein
MSKEIDDLNTKATALATKRTARLADPKHDVAEITDLTTLIGDAAMAISWYSGGEGRKGKG